MNLDQRLVDAAIDQLDRRWPAAIEAVAAALYLDGGEILTSVGFDNINAAANLCAETGALCQAFTMNQRVTASVCVQRDLSSNTIRVLAPCGICQERLAVWGPMVQVGTPSTSAAGWSMRTLAELHPYYWAATYSDDGHWPAFSDHSD